MDIVFLRLRDRARDHRGLDGDRPTGGDRRRTWLAKPQRSGGRRLTAFLLREEWAPAQGKKVGRRRCGQGERGAAGLRSDLTIEEAAKVSGLIMQTRRKALSTIGYFKKVGAEFHGEVAPLSSRPKGARFVPETGPFVFDHLDQDPRAWSPDDRQLARELVGYWTNFAKTGDPNGKGLAPWPAFDGTEASVRRLGASAEIRERGALPDFDSFVGR